MVDTPDRRELTARPGYAGLLAMAGMILFALLIPSSMPWPLLAPAVLILVAVDLSIAFRSGESPLDILGVQEFSRKVGIWIIIGALIGVCMGIAYRSVWMTDLLPQRIGGFIIIAIAIGSVEELLYRGYIQGRLMHLSWPIAITLAAAGHTAYKAALFISPPVGVQIDMGPLVVWTFICGSVMGLIRHLSGSVLPAVTVHAVFDILAYAESTQAPWWVW